MTPKERGDKCLEVAQELLRARYGGALYYGRETANGYACATSYADATIERIGYPHPANRGERHKMLATATRPGGPLQPELYFRLEHVADLAEISRLRESWFAPHISDFFDSVERVRQIAK